MLSFRTISKIRYLRFLLGMFLFVNISDRFFVSWTQDEMFREAISEKKKLEYDYDGYHRIVEPHVYGRMNNKNGILAYQTEGESSSKNLGWKRMYSNKISNMRILDETFDGKREVSGKHSVWDLIYLIVD